jgi:uncharacterized surface protein with fasciclin (FAS1) repeats
MTIDTKYLKLGSLAAACSFAFGCASFNDRDSAADQRATPSSQSSASQARSQSGAVTFDRIAQQDSSLSDFSQAIKAAGMEDSLTDGRSYTIFAPTNTALDSKSGMPLAELMRPEHRTELVSLLRAHIVADDVSPEEARTLPAAKTIDGGTVDLKNENGTLMIGDARLAEPNPIHMGNLRVYPIDRVLAANSQPQLPSRG